MHAGWPILCHTQFVYVELCIFSSNEGYNVKQTSDQSSL